ncbi:MAG: hypothetical protein EXR11_06930 [Rhodospirillaceae bacterium]|nr:hypothetical protein [Rhodospirillaceae bacterium]
MSTAQVVNTTMISSAARIARARGSVSTSFQSVDALDTNLAARGRGDFSRRDELDDFEAPTSRPRRGEFQDQVVRFSGVLLSRDVGTTIVQAQAASSRTGSPTIASLQAERNIAEYEFNQSLMGAPLATTETGIVH